MTNDDPLDKVFMTPQERLSIALSKLPDDMREALKESINQRIAAAVSSERERCAKVAGGIWHLKDVDGSDIDHVVTDPIADAIRALQ